MPQFYRRVDTGYKVPVVVTGTCWVAAMLLLNILQGSCQSSTARNYPAPNVSGAVRKARLSRNGRSPFHQLPANELWGGVASKRTRLDLCREKLTLDITTYARMGRHLAQGSQHTD